MAKVLKEEGVNWVAFSYIVALILIAVIFVSQPYFEARAFNKFKKADQQEATYWDALFSNLRIGTD